jgi:hypothetical protein
MVAGDYDVPGTIYLVDVNRDGHRDDGGDIVLNPRPSLDPEDPLNWNRGRKILAVTMVYIYVIAIGIATAVQYSVLTPIAEETSITVAELNLGTGLMFLFLGWACLIWQQAPVRLCPPSGLALLLTKS